MDSMQTSMSNLSNSMLASQVASGTSLIGQQVIASTDAASLTTGGTVTGMLAVPSTATSVQVQVADANGNVVSNFSVTPPSGGGDATFSWNGLTSSGAPAPTGIYTFNVTAAGGGMSATLTPMFASTVQSISVDPEQPDPLDQYQLRLRTPELGRLGQVRRPHPCHSIIALSGVDAANTDLNVISNNIANVDTTGFKESETEFADCLRPDTAGSRIDGHRQRRRGRGRGAAVRPGKHHDDVEQPRPRPERQRLLRPEQQRLGLVHP